MRLPGAVGQVNNAEYLFDASGTISSGGTAQLLLPRARSRSSLIINNISDTAMYIEFGGARATASLSSGAVSSCSITNAGLGFSLAPTVHFLGGGYDNRYQTTPTFSIVGLPEWPSPISPAGRPAKAHCVMTGSAPNMTVSSIVIDDPGAGYAYPPYVQLRNDPNDPYGCAVPSATSGILLAASGGSYTPNGTVCSTDQFAVYCATSGKAFTVKWTL